MKSQESYLNLKVLQDFAKLQKLIFPSWKSDSFWCFIALILVASVEQYLIYKVGLITGEFYQVLGEKNQDAFTLTVLNSLALLLAISLFKSIRAFLAKILGVTWRKHLTNAIHQLYFEHIRFYRLSALCKFLF
jgi:ABC-type uncharacterized transport system fused permease/ATPase subunit